MNHSMFSANSSERQDLGGVMGAYASILIFSLLLVLCWISYYWRLYPVKKKTHARINLEELETDSALV